MLGKWIRKSQEKAKVESLSTRIDAIDYSKDSSLKASLGQKGIPFKQAADLLAESMSGFTAPGNVSIKFTKTAGQVHLEVKGYSAVHMIRSCHEEGMSSDQILDAIAIRFPHQVQDQSSKNKIMGTMRSMGFETPAPKSKVEALAHKEKKAEILKKILSRKVGQSVIISCGFGVRGDLKSFLRSCLKFLKARHGPWKGRGVYCLSETKDIFRSINEMSKSDWTPCSLIHHGGSLSLESCGSLEEKTLIYSVFHGVANKGNILLLEIIGMLEHISSKKEI